ncbi:zinc-finger protein, conserved [Leishmania panamensis]|uniref:Zinc-finger protein, conserved n=1 Tax=Leishmania panamensis TaxID=5679 RepID=A0A088RYS4_LEIPA|nr:zinc-finger protein, conserved [Leishmania panamensis]AIO00455.1 zinc-finger protein, conserved [Leishmania panamensis]
MSARVITCGICFNVLNQPLTLECNHSFCAKCIRIRLAESGNSGLQCPLCGTSHTELHSHNLAQYADHEAEVYVEMLSRDMPDRPTCQWCETTTAKVQCGECRCVYCEECSIAVHRNSAKRDHAIGKLSESSRNFMRRCQLRGHEEYRAEFFCSQCRQICCAYCLQVGPHRDHLHVTVAAAAAEARQQLSRDMQSLVEVKHRLEQQAAEMNRVSVLYTDTYDAVENTVTERFETFKQQLMQRELEVRRTLTKLRDSGDATLTASRQQYLDKLNNINATLLQFRSIQNSGTDDEVLQRHSQLGNCLNTDLPAVTGSGFKVVDLGEMTLTSLGIDLDLQTVEHNQHILPRLNRSARLKDASKMSINSGASVFSFAGNRLSMPLRLTFPVDDDVEATVLAEGVRLRCVARGGGATQIGVRSKEMFRTLLGQFPEDRGVVSWQVRLDSISDSFIGVVEKPSQAAQVPEGFYWKPTCAGVTDGRIGRYTSAVCHLPVCRNGDHVRFVYDGDEGSLRVVINDRDDCGVVVADLHPRIAACFIFYPSESLTVLF